MNDALMPTYARIDLAFERGQGPYLFDGEGRRYLDFAAGIAVNSLGHAHPRLVAALTGQAEKLWHCSNLYRIPDGERLAERLCAASFAERVFFCNSGAEAMECSIKAARRYHDEQGQPERYRIVTFTGAFHGRTLATLSAAANPKHMAGFAPAVDGFDQVAFDNMNELRAAITPETAAVLIEPVQGEGGVRVATPDFLRALRRVCDEFGLLLILDEVQCGIGRTGRFFAHEAAGIAPDVMAVAKGLGGGFPIGACLATAAVGDCLTAGSHGSTFGGNPLAMAAGNAVLDVVLADGFLSRVEAIAALMRDRLETIVARYPGVATEVRGAGLLIGLRCEVPNTELLAAIRADGLLAATAGDNVLRLAPPLIIDESHVEEAVAILERACGKLAGSD
ncbi:MAG TPA: aspartate aminotransferase family protein [Kiloniellales bacterium]